MNNYKRRIIWLLTDVLLLSLVVTFLFSSNIHRALRIKKNNGGYQKSIELSQNLLAYSSFDENSGESFIGGFSLDRGTILYLENAYNNALIGYYIDKEENKRDVYIDMSETVLLPELQQYMFELNEINYSRASNSMKKAVIQDYPISLIFAIILALLNTVIAKDNNKYHAICLVTCIVLVIVLSFIAQRFSLPI